MARKKKGARIIERTRGGVTRYYADFRGTELASVLDREAGEASGKIALKAEGENVATSDRGVADALYADKLKELWERKRTKVSVGRWKGTELGPYAAEHLVKKAKAGKVVDRWLQSVEKHLQEAVGFFEAETDLAAIGTAEVGAYAEHLATVTNGRGGKLTTASQRKYLNSLSNLFRRALSEGIVTLNPVAALMDKPVAVQREAHWLEVHDASLFLEATKRYKPTSDAPTIPAAMLHAIVATFLLTGGRKSEVLGLTVGDVSMERGKVTFRTHEHRRLKTDTSKRSVPLWPQLREILVPYMASMKDKSPKALLFPSPRGAGMLVDVRKALDAVGELAGWDEGEIRTKAFRHTYCAARLQNATRVLKPGTDEVQWIPVSRDEVAREMGHGGSTLVARVYGHVGDKKVRGEVPEYRVENHRKELGKRLTALRLVA
jgi:integrase